MSSSTEPLHNRAWFQILVGLSTIGAFVLGIGVFLRDDDGDGGRGPGTSTTSQTSTAPTSTPTTTLTTTTTTTTTEVPPPPPIPTRVDQISIYIEALQGRKVGPTTYAFDGNLDFGLGYGWTGTAGGVEVDSEDCQIRMQVNGPESFPAQRTAECSKPVGGSFNGGINSERIKTPGDYTVTVTDELTGTTQSVTFTLVAG